VRTSKQNGNCNARWKRGRRERKTIEMLLAHLIPPEQLLSALLLQVFYGIRSERQLIEQLDYNLSKDRQ
jgi:hypothetical protein